MTAISTVPEKAAREPLLKLPHIPWPEGTTWFAFRTWIALAFGFYAAFWLELDGASSAGVCVLILAQPAQGMVLSKSIYRLSATVIGVIVATMLTALFPQDRTMLLASFAVVMAFETALGTIFRDFRSYACILAGYTIAIVSISNINAPDQVFAASINRVAAIVVGIAAIGITNAFLATAESSRSLLSKLREATLDITALALKAIEERKAPDASTCIDLAARLMPLRSEISFATPEKPNGRNRARGARSALLGLFETISAIQAVGAGLGNLKQPSTVVDDAVAVTRKALRLQNPEKCQREIEALGRPAIEAGTLTMPEAYVLERLHFLLLCLGHVRDGMRSLRMGWRPRRTVSVAVHQDWFAVVLNAVRVLVALGIVAVLAIWSGIADTATAILFTAVFVSLGAVQPDPNVMGKTALFGMPAVVVAGTFYSFFLLPILSGYPLFIIALAPLVVAICWFIKIGMGGAGLIFGVQTIVQISPANVQTLDPDAFVQTSTMLVVSGISIFLAFQLILPVQPSLRRLRVALAVGKALRRALADNGKLEQPRASLHYDRLAQFKTWQGHAAPSVARRNTMKRLVDIGNLNLAVRRTWRHLDKARNAVSPELDARAREILPSLAPDETFALATEYLRAADGRTGDGAIAIVHAAAGLYGTALGTSNELRLLQHAKLLRRKL